MTNPKKPIDVIIVGEVEFSIYQENFILTTENRFFANKKITKKHPFVVDNVSRQKKERSGCTSPFSIHGFKVVDPNHTQKKMGPENQHGYPK